MKKQRIQLNKELRKFIVMLLVVTMMTALCACTDQPTQAASTQGTKVDTTEVEPTKAAEPTPEPIVEEPEKKKEPDKPEDEIVFDYFKNNY